MDFSVNEYTLTTLGLAGSEAQGLTPAVNNGYCLSLNNQQSDLRYGSKNDFINLVNNRSKSVFAGDGNNVIFAGDGNNFVITGSGRDLIITGSGNDSVYGGEGVNSILTGNGNDLINGGDDDDIIYGGLGSDIIYPGKGNNLIAAGSGNDQVFLRAGKDKIVLEAGQGSVTVFGFDVQNDKLHLGESLQGKSLKFESLGSDTLVKFGNDTVARLRGVATGSQALIDNGSVYRYQATDLGSLSSNPDGSVLASSINDCGQIAGRYDTGATYTLPGATQTSNVRQGFIWENGLQTALTSTGVKRGQSAQGYPSGTVLTLLSPNVRAIGNSGVVIGTADETLNTRKPERLPTDRALAWQKKGNTYSLTINDFGNQESYFLDINNNNQNAGRHIFVNKYEEPIYWENGVITRLKTLGGNGGTANGLNNKGQLVGYIDADKANDTEEAYTAAVWEKNTQEVYQLKILGTFGAEQARLRDINDGGQIIGTTSSGSGATLTSTPFLFRNNLFTGLGSLGGMTGSVNGINEFGQVVGASAIASGTNHAYVWNGGLMSDLNSLITSPLTYNGATVTLTNAVSINNFGDIVATGTYNYKDSEGKDQTGTRSYLLKASI